MICSPATGDAPFVAMQGEQAQGDDRTTLEDTISVLVKHEADIQKARRQLINPSPTTRGKPDEFGRFSGN